MQDDEIVELLFRHSDEGIQKMSEKYGSFLHVLAKRIVKEDADAEECVNDTYLKVWNVIPPYRPSYFRSFLCKIVRQIAIDRYRFQHRLGRDRNGEVLLSELENQIQDPSSVEEELARNTLIQEMNQFLSALDVESQTLFLRRYFFGETVKELAERFLMSENLLSVKLFRVRTRLKKYLEKRGYQIEKI